MVVISGKFIPEVFFYLLAALLLGCRLSSSAILLGTGFLWESSSAGGIVFSFEAEPRTGRTLEEWRRMKI